jgi:hypothetical protein
MAEFEVRLARPEDARAMAELFAVVAAERTGIASEPPVHIDERTAIFEAGATAAHSGRLHTECNFRPLCHQ